MVMSRYSLFVCTLFHILLTLFFVINLKDELKSPNETIDFNEGKECLMVLKSACPIAEQGKAQVLPPVFYPLNR